MTFGEEFRSLVLGLSTLAWEVKCIGDLAFRSGFRLSDCYTSEGGEPHLRVSMAHPSGITWHVHKNNDEFFFQRLFLEVHEDVGGLDEADYLQRLGDFSRWYSAAVSAVRGVLGPETFSGATGEEGFPWDYGAAHVTLWRVLHGHLMVTQEERWRRDDPLALAIVLTPLREPGE